MGTIPPEVREMLPQLPDHLLAYFHARDNRTIDPPSAAIAEIEADLRQRIMPAWQEAKRAWCSIPEPPVETEPTTTGIRRGRALLDL